jgi:hypothetical protein
MNLTRDEIVLAYRLLLNRTAADNEIDHMSQHFADAQSLRKAILLSDEFSSRFDTMVRERDALQQPTLIHVHIPKTAGTTLVNALASEDVMKPSALFHDHMLPELAAMPMARRRTLRYVHGHLDMTVGSMFGAPHRLLCVLRRPGPRIFSFYRFILRTTDHPSHQEIRNLKLGFGEYLEYSLEQRNHRLEIDNGQLRRLSSNLNDGKFDVAHTYVVPALHAVTTPGMILGYAEHMDSLLERLRAEGYLSAEAVQNENVAPSEGSGNSYEAALAEMTENQKNIFNEFTVWDNYFYDLCLNVLPPAK